jgi:hypothetical protein
MLVLRTEAEVEAETLKIVKKILSDFDRKSALRKVVYGILWYQFGLFPKQLTRKIMDSVAAQVGGRYVHNEKGNSRIVI